MNELVCTGWDGANPLHAMAALGLLRLADRMQPGSRLGWRLEASAWRPVLAPVADPSAWFGDAAGWLNLLGRLGAPNPALDRRVRELGAAGNKLRAARKDAANAARAAARRDKLDKQAAVAALAEAVGPIDEEIERNAADTADAKEAVAAANGAGVAHLGEVIGVTPAVYRAAALAAADAWLAAPRPPAERATDDPVLVAGQLAALACDQLVDGGKVVPTPLSFSNGSSGQCLLKDARACLAAVTPERMKASLLQSGDPNVIDQTGLNWDPADQRSYALSWEDPATAGKAADVSANSLAFLGLGLLPCMPARRGLTACGWSVEKAFTWPIWEPLLALPVVGSLLATEHPANPALLRPRGIRELRRSKVINPTGKRNFFAPSVPVG